MADLKFDNVYQYEDKNMPIPGAAQILYNILKDRSQNPEENISHTTMPTYESHVDFIYGRPYKDWLLIWSNFHSVYVGACYLTNDYELGVYIHEIYRKHGYGYAAILELLSKEGPNIPYYANINPANAKSIKLFEKAGFTHIQNTYKLS